MNLPAFDALGNLPEAVYSCDLSDLHQYFVAPFPASKVRHDILEGYLRLRQLYESYGLSATQWIDGSFITRKLDPSDPKVELEPSDIDVVTFVHASALNSLPAPARNALIQLIDSKEFTKPLFRTHSMGVPYYPNGHPMFPKYERYRAFWRDRFSRHSPPSQRTPGEMSLPWPSDAPRKGFISITLGDPNLAPCISVQRV